MTTDGKYLEKQVRDFVKKQKGYNKNEQQKLRAYCDNKNTWGVIYGESPMVGIAGYGETPELAFKDFTRSWIQLKGFEWIKNIKNQQAKY